MKMNAQELDQYYQSLGIHAGDLLVAEPLSVADLPTGLDLFDVQVEDIRGVIRQWNDAEDPREKIDMAQAMERRVLRARTSLSRDQVTEAWAAYLMLGRVRGHEARRDAMQALARGEALPPRPRTRTPKAKPTPVRRAAVRSEASAELPWTPTPLEDEA